MARALSLFINGVSVGVLDDSAGVWSFRYAADWLNSPGRYALSPSLRLQDEPIVDGSSERPVQWFFDNLLPEEGQRTLLAKSARLAEADAFGLLAHYGAESAGALTLYPAGEAEPTEGSLKRLTDKALSARIKALPNSPLIRKSSKRMSLAGAQHKLAVVIDEGALYEPIGATPSTHILKPDHPDPDYPHSVINEWFTMRLAREMGLDVPDVERRLVPEPVYLIRRFDRVESAQGWARVHAIDACQLLNLDRSFKYAQGGVETLARLAKACRAPAVARTRLFSWLVFNVLTGNGDAHLKNLSFLVKPDGIQLAPHYDLLSTGLYGTRLYNQTSWPKLSELAWPIEDIDRFCDISFDVLVSAGITLGLQKATAERLARVQRDKIVIAAQALYDRMLEQTPAVSAAEQKCVRGLIHTIIRQMVSQIRG